MTTVQPADSLSFPAARGTCPFSPPPAYEEARESHPVRRITLWDGSQCWLITRHADVRAVLGDRRFSADAHRSGFPFYSEGRKQLVNPNQAFMRQDDPEHSRMRRMFTGDFMVKRIEALRPQIQRIVDDVLDGMIARGAPGDLVADYALPIPSRVICLLLGVPYGDSDFFEQRSRDLLDDRRTPAEIRAARDDLFDYLLRLAERKAKEPDDGIVSNLVARGELDLPQIASTARLLLVAGHETTANSIALSALVLLRNPGKLGALRGSSENIKVMVEELLRYAGIVQTGLPRVATEDVTVHGQTIRAGEGVLCMISTANRDPEVFPGGGELDLERDPRGHVAFGFGPHNCLGQTLARVEMQTSLGTLFRRLPGLRLDVPFEELPFRDTTRVYGVHDLPVAW